MHRRTCLKHLAAGAATLAVGTAHAQKPATTGRIIAHVQPATGLTGVTAIDRQARKKYSGRVVDPKTGRVAVTGLPLGRTFDLVVDFGATRRLEGINLAVPRSDYVEEQPLSKEDIEIIRKKVKKLNKFEDKVDILTIQGNIQHAAILLNKLRTRPFFGSKPGEIIWRAELWHFERPEETWLKVQDELFILLYRERMQNREYVRKSLTYEPKLGGLKLTAERSIIEIARVAPPMERPGVRLRGVKGRPEKPATNKELPSPK